MNHGVRMKTFRVCMLIGAVALGAVALYYFIRYAVVLDVALDNSGVRASLQASIRALWLAFAFQALLIALKALFSAGLTASAGPDPEIRPGGGTMAFAIGSESKPMPGTASKGCTSPSFALM